MAASKNSLTESQLDDLAGLCGIDLRRLDTVAHELANAKFTLHRGEIKRLLTNILDQTDGERLDRLLFGIAVTFRRSRQSATQILDRISGSLAEDLDREDGSPAITRGLVDGWTKRRPVIEHMLRTPVIALTAKAIDISYDFERVFLGARLLTSIRPIFDDGRDEIVGTTVVQTLRLDFLSGEGKEANLSFAMDIEDVRLLAEECEKAMKKAGISRELIETSCEVDAIIMGERSE